VQKAGYLTRFSLEKQLSDDGKIYFNLEIALASSGDSLTPKNVIRFLDIRNLLLVTE